MKRNIAAFLSFCALLMTALLNAQQSFSTSGQTDSTRVLKEDDSHLTFNRQPVQDATLNIPLSKGESDKFSLEDLKEAYVYDSLWLKELAKNDTYFKEMYDEVINSPKDSLALAFLPTDTLKARLRLLDEKTPFNIAYNPSLERVINSFLKGKRGLIQRMLTASQFYFPLFEQELDNQNIPLEVKYLAIVESALNPRARSRVGATGLWQFMFATGKMYGLDVSSYVDERRDPIASTKSASKYLAKLYGIFGDWDLALAAYNSGPGNVNKAIRRSGGYKNYWNIRRNLPRETAGYLPAFLATMYLFEYAEEHGFERVPIERPYFETDTVHIKELVTFEQISKTVGISMEELKVLNPQYKLNIIPKVKDKAYALRLPLLHLGKFVSNEDAIYAYAKSELAKQEKPLPQMVNSSDRIRYKVKSGDYLGKIAERYGVRISQIKRWNGLRTNNLRIGQRLTIYPRKPAANAAKQNVVKTHQKPVQVILPNDPSKIHEVQSGDSLWTISKKYPGISIENLREWNGISGNNLKPGTKLRLCNCSS